MRTTRGSGCVGSQPWREGKSTCERERARVCVRVRVCERERVCVCMSERERERLNASASLMFTKGVKLIACGGHLPGAFCV